MRPARLFRQVNMGAKAIRTGSVVGVERGRALPCPDLIQPTSDTSAFVSFSSALKRIALKLSKNCNELRLL